MTTAQYKTQKGFTLIELLVVIGILAVLLAIVLIAINPARQFAQANDTKRNADVVAILNAISQYAADYKGVLPPGSPASGNPAINIANSTTGQSFCDSLMPRYLAALPTDPTGAGNGSNVTNCANYNTGYSIQVSLDNRVTISAISQISPSASISATR
jgi:prepilin-type N-terminal cleavage/methylation domain-containing protein